MTSSNDTNASNKSANPQTSPKATPLGDNSGVHLSGAAEDNVFNTDISLDFGGFIISLGTSCMVHLGKFESPELGQDGIDLPAAKHVIHILTILQNKTKGNLEPDEDKLLSSLIYDLKLAYLEASKSVSGVNK